jgi:hypothetical protein
LPLALRFAHARRPLRTRVEPDQRQKQRCRERERTLTSSKRAPMKPTRKNGRKRDRERPNKLAATRHGHSAVQNCNSPMQNRVNQKLCIGGGIRTLPAGLDTQPPNQSSYE